MWLLGFELRTFGRAVGCSYPLSHLTSPKPILLWNYLTAVLISFSCSILSTLGAESDLFYLNPFAIPARIVCPFFKMHPNGIPIENDSFLLNTGTVIPAALFSLILAVLCFLLTAWLFSEGDRTHD